MREYFHAQNLFRMMQIDGFFFPDFFSLRHSRLNKGSRLQSTNAKSKTFWTIISAIASFTINFAFSFTQNGRIHSFRAEVASEATFMPSFASSPHQFSNEHRFVTTRADLSSTPFWFSIGCDSSRFRRCVSVGLGHHSPWCNVGLRLMIHM